MDFKERTEASLSTNAIYLPQGLNMLNIFKIRLNFCDKKVSAPLEPYKKSQSLTAFKKTAIVMI
ncbi:hypothetical protein [Flavobacterium sp. 2]|uniref:hypothetical protein n=1 Tax=Flavobacterium sp. 2 TaxID=308053 RepID=UPI003CF4FB69